MSSSAGEFGAGRPDKAWELQPSPPPAGGVRDSFLLDKVLQETLSAGSIQQLRPDEVQALTDIVRRHRDIVLVVDSIAAELVEALLSTRFAHLQATPEFWREASRRIAVSLCEAPDSHERLSRFWTQLCELVP